MNQQNLAAPSHPTWRQRLAATATVNDLPTEVETLGGFEVINRRGRVLARLLPSRGPDGCGVDYLMPDRLSGAALHPRGSVGAPANTPPALLIGMARKLADRFQRTRAPAARVRRISAAHQKD